MPTFDGTGPEGLGVKTGRGFGPCGTRHPANFKHERGSGPGCGGGRGLGRNRGWFSVGYGSESARPINAATKEILASHRQALLAELERTEAFLNANVTDHC
ncbi:MAG: DUF5320 domain-containing protein [Spirochaetales bacterium]|jgi:hypothetical protein